MAKLTRDDVLKLARLARIDLSEAEVAEFAIECSEILAYVEKLKDVDVTGLQPTSQVTGLTNVMRDDVVASYGYTSDELLAHVPVQQNSYIQVKRMLG